MRVVHVKGVEQEANNTFEVERLDDKKQPLVMYTPAWNQRAGLAVSRSVPKHDKTIHTVPFASVAKFSLLSRASSRTGGVGLQMNCLQQLRDHGGFFHTKVFVRARGDAPPPAPEATQTEYAPAAPPDAAAAAAVDLSADEPAAAAAPAAGLTDTAATAAAAAATSLPAPAGGTSPPPPPPPPPGEPASEPVTVTVHVYVDPEHGQIRSNWSTARNVLLLMSSLENAPELLPEDASWCCLEDQLLSIERVSRTARGATSTTMAGLLKDLETPQPKIGWGVPKALSSRICVVRSRERSATPLAPGAMGGAAGAGSAEAAGGAPGEIRGGTVSPAVLSSEEVASSQEDGAGAGAGVGVGVGAGAGADTSAGASADATAVAGANDAAGVAGAAGAAATAAGAAITGALTLVECTSVQCNACEKWRYLPSHVDPESLPEEWLCKDNVWDAARRVCSAAEELFRPDPQPGAGAGACAAAGGSEFTLHPRAASPAGDAGAGAAGGGGGGGRPKRAARAKAETAIKAAALQADTSVQGTAEGAAAALRGHEERTREAAAQQAGGAAGAGGAGGAGGCKRALPGTDADGGQPSDPARRVRRARHVYDGEGGSALPFGGEGAAFSKCCAWRQGRAY